MNELMIHVQTERIEIVNEERVKIHKFIVHLKHCIHLMGSSLGGWTALSSDTCPNSAHTRISLPNR